MVATTGVPNDNSPQIVLGLVGAPGVAFSLARARLSHEPGRGEASYWHIGPPQATINKAHLPVSECRLRCAAEIAGSMSGLAVAAAGNFWVT